MSPGIAPDLLIGTAAEVQSDHRAPRQQWSEPGELQHGRIDQLLEGARGGPASGTWLTSTARTGENRSRGRSCRNRAQICIWYASMRWASVGSQEL